VHYSFAPACSWDVGQVTAVVKRDGHEEIFDWTYSDERQERHINDYRSTGIYRMFIGAAVRCAGIRKTSESDYTPPSLSVPYPLRLGYAWDATTKTTDRTERLSGSVLAHRTRSVPAGRFDAWQVRVSGTFSGGQSGSFATTFWFAPSLGTIVEQTTTIDARSGDAHFESQMTIKLASLPS
jgi:YD repeat-containing protein